MSEVIETAPPIKGFKVASVHCGLKPAGDLDFVLIVSEAVCVGAGSFTTNPFVSESIRLNQMRLESNPNSIRAVVIHTGCANAFTGQTGKANAAQVARWVAERLGCEETAVLVLSSGEVGTQLPMVKLRCGVDLAFEALGDDWDAAAKAIRTTDKTAKIWWREIYGVQILGIKSAHVAVLVSDAAIRAEDLDDTLYWAVNGSFENYVTDDGTDETAVIMLCNGASNIQIQGDYRTNWGVFGLDVRLVCDELAWLNTKDENGATKIIEIEVRGAPGAWWDSVNNWTAAHKIAYTIASSMRVRTGLYNNVLNWGEVLAAAGRAGVPLSPEKLTLWLMPGYISEWPEGAVTLYLNGQPMLYDDELVKSIVSSSRFNFVLYCGDRQGSDASFGTSDLSPEYITLNSSYRH